VKSEQRAKAGVGETLFVARVTLPGDTLIGPDDQAEQRDVIPARKMTPTAWPASANE